MSDTPTPGSVLIGQMTPPNATIVARLAQSVTSDDSDVIDLSAIVECNFPGYAPVILDDWEDVDPGSEDAAQLVSAIIQFMADGIDLPQEAVAFYCTITAPGVDVTGLFSIENFPIPFTFAKDGDFLERQIRQTQALDA